MKISKQKLVQVINEEVQRVLFEAKKMKINVKGKKAKSMDEVGANVSSYNHDYLDREEETEYQRDANRRYEREKEEYLRRKEEEDRFKPVEKSGDQSGYWNYSESKQLKKKVKT